MPRPRTTKDEFIERLSKERPGCKLIGDYRGWGASVEFICEECGRTSHTDPGQLLKGKNCKYCKRIKGTYEIKVRYKGDEYKFKGANKFGRYFESKEFYSHEYFKKALRKKQYDKLKQFDIEIIEVNIIKI